MRCPHCQQQIGVRVSRGALCVGDHWVRNAAEWDDDRYERTRVLCPASGQFLQNTRRRTEHGNH